MKAKSCRHDLFVFPKTIKPFQRLQMRKNESAEKVYFFFYEP